MLDTIRRHRLSLGLGAVFVVDGIVYWAAQAYLGAPRTDLTGVVGLIALGGAMAFVFGVLLGGSDEAEE